MAKAARGDFGFGREDVFPVCYPWPEGAGIETSHDKQKCYWVIGSVAHVVSMQTAETFNPTPKAPRKPAVRCSPGFKQ